MVEPEFPGEGKPGRNCNLTPFNLERNHLVSAAQDQPPNALRRIENHRNAQPPRLAHRKEQSYPQAARPAAIVRRDAIRPPQPAGAGALFMEKESLWVEKPPTYFVNSEKEIQI